jgi:Tol biopolymer transport system component
MTTERRLERDLPFILGDLAIGPYPDYIDDVLATTAQRRQRPAWMFPERWLPMAVVTRRPVPAPSVPWRTIGALVLILSLIAAALAAYIGSQTRLPAPFGPARNGLIVYEAGGDIYTVDPLTGATTAILTGPETDVAPIWSRDGTHFAFKRKVQGTSGLYVARADGRGLASVTPETREHLANYAFSPDGREIMFTSGLEQEARLWIVKTDGSDLRQLDVGMSVVDPSYRPPNGAEIVFAGRHATEERSGLYAVDVASGVVRTILTSVRGRGDDADLLVQVSPDGSRIAYSVATAGGDINTYGVHIVGADGSEHLTVPLPELATFQDAPAWSNDGQHLAVVRGYWLRNEDITLAVVPADGSGFGVETEHGLTGCCDTIYEWAPDDTTILVAPFDLSGFPLPQLLWDPSTGVTVPASWAAKSDPAWQRLAP